MENYFDVFSGETDAAAKFSFDTYCAKYPVTYTFSKLQITLLNCGEFHNNYERCHFVAM